MLQDNLKLLKQYAKIQWLQLSHFWQQILHQGPHVQIWSNPLLNPPQIRQIHIPWFWMIRDADAQSICNLQFRSQENHHPSLYKLWSKSFLTRMMKLYGICLRQCQLQWNLQLPDIELQRGDKLMYPELQIHLSRPQREKNKRANLTRVHPHGLKVLHIYTYICHLLTLENL